MGSSISVVIPVFNAAHHLRQCLKDLATSEASYLECIVVDDGSTDDSVAVAKGYGAKVLATPQRLGPAHARNLGAQAAQGDILLFLDADVCAYPDTLQRITGVFAEDPDLDAVIGSYDDSPGSKDFLSQYRNLMHSFVHQRGRRQACTFWSGCGAIRREVFLEHTGFDESYGRPAIEDIELGYRLCQARRKVVLDKDILVKHLKRWTFWGLVKTDVLDRGIPWTELILRDRHMPNDLNLELSQRVSVALAFVLVGVTAAAVVWWGGYFLTPLLAVLFLLLARDWLEPAAHNRPRYVIVVIGAAIGLFVYLAYSHHMIGVVPPLLLAFPLLILRHRYEHASDRRRRMMGIILGAYIAGALAFMISYFPAHILIFIFFLVAALIVILNNQFYLFLAQKRGRFFALAAVPFHLLYHLYNGISFLAGLSHFAWRSLLRRGPRPTPVRQSDEPT